MLVRQHKLIVREEKRPARAQVQQCPVSVFDHSQVKLFYGEHYFFFAAILSILCILCKLFWLLLDASKKSCCISSVFSANSSLKTSTTSSILGLFEISTCQLVLKSFCIRGDHLLFNLGRKPPFVTFLSNIFMVKPSKGVSSEQIWNRRTAKEYTSTDSLYGCSKATAWSVLVQRSKTRMHDTTKFSLTFWSHVSWRSCIARHFVQAILRLPAWNLTREPKIKNLDITSHIKTDIVRLEITVDNALRERTREYTCSGTFAWCSSRN